jgi:hypothetical protein
VPRSRSTSDHGRPSASERRSPRNVTHGRAATARRRRRQSRKAPACSGVLTIAAAGRLPVRRHSCTRCSVHTSARSARPDGSSRCSPGFTGIVRRFTAVDRADVTLACTRPMVASDSGRRAAAVSDRASSSRRSIGDGRPSMGRPICRIAAWSASRSTSRRCPSPGLKWRLRCCIQPCRVEAFSAVFLVRGPVPAVPRFRRPPTHDRARRVAPQKMDRRREAFIQSVRLRRAARRSSADGPDRHDLLLSLVQVSGTSPRTIWCSKPAGSGECSVHHGGQPLSRNTAVPSNDAASRSHGNRPGIGGKAPAEIRRHPKGGVGSGCAVEELDRPGELKDPPGRGTRQSPQDR